MRNMQGPELRLGKLSVPSGGALYDKLDLGKEGTQKRHRGVTNIPEAREVGSRR